MRRVGCCAGHCAVPEKQHAVCGLDLTHFELSLDYSGFSCLFEAFQGISTARSRHQSWVAGPVCQVSFWLGNSFNNTQ